MKLRVFLAATSILALINSQAATFTVTNTGDGGPGSLRQAILDANGTNGDDTISFTVTGTITLGSALPPITDSTTISGPGTNLLIVSGNNAVRGFSFNGGTTNTLSDLTIANCLATGYANGSGIANAGVLTLLNCALINNTNLGGWGGAVFNSGVLLEAVGCAFTRNAVIGAAGEHGGWRNGVCGFNSGGGGGAGMGGAFFNTAGSATLRHSCFMANSATGGKGGDWDLGGCGGGGGVNGGRVSSNVGGPGGFGGGGAGAWNYGGNGGFGGGGGGAIYYSPGAGGFGGGTGGRNGGSSGAGGGGGAFGGAIFLDTGRITIVSCSFASNSVAGGPPGIQAIYGVGTDPAGGGAFGPDFHNRVGQVWPALVATTPGGGTITVDPPNPPYLSSSWATLTATPAPGWQFLYWLGDATGTNQTTAVKMTRNKYVQAVFGTSFTGSVLMSLIPQSDFYPYGTVVKLTALPPIGTYLASWSGDVSGTSNPLNLTVTNPNQNVSCLLGTLGVGQFALTSIENGWGHVSVTPLTNHYTSGESATLTAIPDAGQDFLGWGGATIGTQNPLSLTMDQSKTITANFTKRPSLRVGTPLEGLTEDGFRLTLIGEFGTPYIIWGSTNFTDWDAAGTVTNIYGTVQLTDLVATNLPFHFYRATAQ